MSVKDSNSFTNVQEASCVIWSNANSFFVELWFQSVA